ncbi:AraC family transcriptional regulator [Nibrella saemangeumensis]|uniref:AraC family transcriptional regulator n=1 Tax=Nibrella saemangeumensis TaxID=1084526 RepID=UPI0031E91318
MKALFEKVTIGEQNSLLVKRLRMTAFDAPWHYHPEYELTYIIRSTGKRFVGDHIGSFDVGDLILIGPNLPHSYRNDDGITVPAEAVVVQFPATFGETLLSNLPEAERIRQMMNRSQYGVQFSPSLSQTIGRRLERLVNRTGMDRVLDMLGILNDLSADSEVVLLASDGYEFSASEADTERMKRVLDYTLSHFREEVRVDDVASVAGMATAAFCRYFRRRTGKSFIEYLTELRISHARKLLTQADLSVGQVGLECGFNNISHFHRQFRLQTGTTPLKYQAAYRAG